MASRIRALDSANRTMQRLGYLKLLCALVNETETSNLASLGKRMIRQVTKRVRINPPIQEDIRDYVRSRLTDRTYRDIRKTVLNKKGFETPVLLEIQDIYLAASALPSRTGKLVETDWQRYPYLGTALDLVKKGTYSALTRSLVLLAVTPIEELAAFNELDQFNNPFRISDAQAMVFAFCLMDRDGEVVLPLFQKLVDSSDETFDERFAGDLLPEILRGIVRYHGKRTLTAEERDRIRLMTKTATSIENWKGKAYTGGGAREIAVRVRLEPYCDIGFLEKPKPDRFDYCAHESLKSLLEFWEDVRNTEGFLRGSFFRSFAACRRWEVKSADEGAAIEGILKAAECLRSQLGYSPITDVALLAGTQLLTERRLLLEISQTCELLRIMQKRNPDSIRFTVNRMGETAYVKFVKHSPGKILGL